MAETNRIGGILGAMGRHPWRTAAMTGLGTAGLGSLFGTHGGRNFMSDLFMGTPGKATQLPTQTPQGMGLLNQLMSQGMQNTDFGGIENMYMKKFYEDIIPGLEDRWASVGDERNSSALERARYGAGSDLMAKLAGLRSQYGLQQSQLGLTPQWENIYEKRTPGLAGTLAKLAPLLARIGMGGF